LRRELSLSCGGPSNLRNRANKIRSCWFVTQITPIQSNKAESNKATKQKAENRKQKAESRKQKAESRKQKAESRKQKAESRKQYCLLPSNLFLIGVIGVICG